MIRALVLTGDGINCEAETAHAFALAGADSTIWHINHLVTRPAALKDFQILALPGGFSFGDEVHSGKILAVKLKHLLGEVLADYIAGDHLVIGICNGFQALVKLGALPQSDLPLRQQVTLFHNRQRRFINRWVPLSVKAKSLFFEGLDTLECPIRHGEGRLVVPHGEEAHWHEALVPHTALIYDEDVNGAFDNIAGLINARGNVLGLMPHPEAFVRPTQHPAWTDRPPTAPPAGLTVFQNMVAALRN